MWAKSGRINETLLDREEVTHVVYMVIFPPVSSYLGLFLHCPAPPSPSSLNIPTHVDIPLQRRCRGDGRQMFAATFATESVRVQMRTLTCASV